MTSALRRALALGGVGRWRLALSLLLASLAVAFGVALLTTAGYLVSRAAERPPILALTTTIVAVRFFGLARPLLRYLDRLASHDLALRALAATRARVYERIEPQAPAGLDAYRSGDLLTRMVADVDALQGIVLRGMTPPVSALAVGAACVAVTGVLLPWAGVVLAVGLLLAGVAVPWLSFVLARSARRRQVAARARLSAELVELLRSTPELAVYGREQAALDRVERLDLELRRLGRRDALVAGVGEALLAVLTGATVAGVLAVSVSASDVGTLDRVLVATLALLALASFDAVTPLVGAARELPGIAASAARVDALVQGEPVVRDPATPLPAPRGRPQVGLCRVVARYPGTERLVLEGVDLRVDRGRRLALVGPSGAGKSTVAGLLLRFLDPVAGSVTLDGADARGYRQHDVRSTFALAGQEAHVFDSTIRENLRLARPGASDDELLAALDRARLADWVRTLPDGLDTLVGEDGARLSGGQRQRLTIARALLADAPVLVLDEPTAHLDTETAEELMRDVLAEAGERSVLLITHRTEGLDLVDEIVRIEKGSLAV